MAKFKKFGEKSRNMKMAVKTSTGEYFIDYKDAEPLRKLMSPNGKILGRKRSGMDSYEQRMAAAAIKRARYMGLLPYTSATL